MSPKHVHCILKLKTTDTRNNTILTYTHLSSNIGPAIDTYTCTQMYMCACMHTHMHTDTDTHTHNLLEAGWRHTHTHTIYLRQDGDTWKC